MKERKKKKIRNEMKGIIIRNKGKGIIRKKKNIIYSVSFSRAG